MFAVTGITGQVGSQLADELMAAGRPLRAVVRDAAKAEACRRRGCEIALAGMDDVAALTAAFAAADSVFVLLPPVFDPAPGFAESRRHVDAVTRALRAARPRHVVALSTIGAQAAPENLLTQLQMLEKGLADVDVRVSVLRAAWFVDNVAWDIETARATGTLPSYLQPCDRAIPMISTLDVARTAAGLMSGSPAGARIVELEGPTRVSPDMLAAALGDALGRSVEAVPVPRSEWEGRFRAQGMHHPQPRMRMLDGFNEGWIAFEGGGAEHRLGTTPLREAVGRVIARHSARL
jgi:uncharacterized protein YbjT (DUF2867 family)